MNSLACVLCALLALAGVPRWAVAGTLLVADAGTNKIIEVDNLDASPTSSDFLTGLNEPRGLALDLANQRLYFVDHDVTSPLTDSIQRVDLDGTNQQTVVSTSGSGQSFVNLGFDLDNSHVYWTNAGPPSVQRANLDGTGKVDIHDSVDGLVTPLGIGLDLVSATKKLYFTDLNTDKLQRSNLDGSSLEDLATGLGVARSLLLDAASGTIYWADSGDDEILKANVADLDGSSLASLKTAGKVTAILDSSDGLVNPWGIGLDKAGGKIYWTDIGAGSGGTDGKLSRANLDGSGAELLVSGLSDPLGVAFVPEPASWLLTVLRLLPLAVWVVGRSKSRRETSGGNYWPIPHECEP